MDYLFCKTDYIKGFINGEWSQVLSRGPHVVGRENGFVYMYTDINSLYSSDYTNGKWGNYNKAHLDCPACGRDMSKHELYASDEYEGTLAVAVRSVYGFGSVYEQLEVVQRIDGVWKTNIPLGVSTGDAKVITYRHGESLVFWVKRTEMNGTYRYDTMLTTIRDGQIADERVFNGVEYASALTLQKNANGLILVAWRLNSTIKFSIYDGNSWTTSIDAVDQGMPLHATSDSVGLALDGSNGISVYWVEEPPCLSPDCTYATYLKGKRYSNGIWTNIKTLDTNPSETRIIASQRTDEAYVVWKKRQPNLINAVYYTYGASEIQHPLNLFVSGDGEILALPSNFSCENQCSNRYTEGTTVILTPSPKAGSAFSHWTGDCTGSGECKLTIDSPKTVGASFISSYTMNVSKTGLGTVTSAPDGISCGASCSNHFTVGSTVSLVAQPDYGYEFSGWGGACSGSGTCAVTMNSDKSVTANFIELNKYPVKITKPSTGVIRSEPAGIVCGGPNNKCISSFSMAKLTASPTPGYEFIRWNGCQAPEGNVCNIKPTGAITLTAAFKKLPKYTVKIVKTPFGSITSTPAGINCTDKKKSCSVKFVKGTEVTLSPVPQQGRSFGGWTGACSGFDPCTFLMNGNKGVGAVFQ